MFRAETLNVTGISTRATGGGIKADRGWDERLNFLEWSLRVEVF